MPHVYEETMNVPKQQKLNFAGDVEVSVIRVVKIKGKLVEVGGSADEEIVLADKSTDAS